MAMLFTYACIDKYLEDGGKFGFLTTQTVFKSMAGENFRKFSFTVYKEGESKKVPFKVTKAHDLVELLPFEGAQNRTGAIFCIKGRETSYPVPYTLWKGPKVDQELSLEEVMKITSRTDLEARPLIRKTGPWSTLRPKAHKVVERIAGPSTYYRAYEGVNTALNASYWVRILDRLSGENFLVENITERAKREVKQIRLTVEASLIYPLLRGRDVERWKASTTLYIILPTDEQGDAMQVSNFRVDYPKAYNFFREFFNQLITRGGEPYKSQLKPWREKSEKVAEKTAPPFYTVFNAKPSLAPYKVVWKEVSPMLNAAVVSPIYDRIVGQKVVVPDHTIVLVPCQEKLEAHFLCATLNSSISRLLVNSYLHMHPSPHVMDYVKVPRYDRNNKTHRRLAELSVRAHTLVSEGKKDEVPKVEGDIDRLIAQLYDLADENLKEVKESLRNLEDRAVEDEEVEE
ncbi:MAG: hypothetical protein H3Z52_05180 [archaeon]|nr:hypothetical protein [archaeon]